MIIIEEIIIYKIHGGFKTIWNYEVQNANGSGYTTIMTRTIWEGSGTKTVTFTEAEQNSFYSFLNTRNSASYRIAVNTYNGNSYMGTKYQYGTIYVGTATPTFSDFDYEDINPTTLELTGDKNKFIKGYSIAQTTISETNKAVAVKKATIVKYRTLIGTQQSEASYKDTGNVLMAINDMDNKEINVYAIDSRGNSKSVKKVIDDSNFIEYTSINIKNASVKRGLGGIGTEVTLSFNGEIFTGNFGTKDNSIISCYYQYKEKNSTDIMIGTTNITPTSISEGTFSNTLKIQGDLGAEGFDNSKSYDFSIIIADELSTYSFNLTLGAGVPLVAHHKNGVAFGALYDEEIGGLIQFNSSNPLPNDTFYGTIARQYISSSISWGVSSLGTISQTYKKGNKLTLENGKIKIGKGIKRIIASGNLTGFNSNQSNGDFIFYVMKNNRAFGTQYFNGSQMGWRPRFYCSCCCRCSRRRFNLFRIWFWRYNKYGNFRRNYLCSSY